MEKTVSCRNVGLWRNLVNVTVENMVIQMYPCGFINMLKGVPNYHTHLYHEMFYVRQGDTDILTTEKIYKFHPDDCFIIPAGLPHFRKEYITDYPPLSYDLRFTIRRATGEHETATDLYGAFRNLFESAGDIIRIPNGGHLRDLCETINSENMNMQPFYELKVKAQITTLFVDLYRGLIEGCDAAPEHGEPPEPQEPEEKAKLDNIYVFIDFLLNRRFANPELKIEEVAEQLRLSVRQTERLVLRLYGKSFKRKLMETRLKNARMILRYTDAPVAEVAQFCGYASHSGLIKAFVTEFGITPSDYRISLRQQ